MKVLKPVYSIEAPNVKDALWLKPEGNGFSLYVFDGVWKSLNVGNNNPTDCEKAGAAKTVKKEIIGTSKDKSTAMTLNGLKAYIDEQIDALG